MKTCVTVVFVWLFFLILQEGYSEQREPKSYTKEEMIELIRPPITAQKRKARNKLKEIYQKASKQEQERLSRLVNQAQLELLEKDKDGVVDTSNSNDQQNEDTPAAEWEGLLYLPSQSLARFLIGLSAPVAGRFLFNSILFRRRIRDPILERARGIAEARRLLVQLENKLNEISEIYRTIEQGRLFGVDPQWRRSQRLNTEINNLFSQLNLHLPAGLLSVFPSVAARQAIEQSLPHLLQNPPWDSAQIRFFLETPSGYEVRSFGPSEARDLYNQFAETCHRSFSHIASTLGRQRRRWAVQTLALSAAGGGLALGWEGWVQYEYFSLREELRNALANAQKTNNTDIIEPIEQLIEQLDASEVLPSEVRERISTFNRLLQDRETNTD